MNEADLIERIRHRSEFRSGFFLPHLGYGGRVADAIWLDLTRNPAVLVGFEMKCARGDWLKELRDPWKSYAIGRFCNRWYLVVSKPDIVRPGELPEGWGLMVADRKTTRIRVRAPVNPDPDDWPKELFLAILNKVSNRGFGPDRDSELDAARKAGREEAQARLAGATKTQKPIDPYELERLRKIEANVAAFEDATGVRITPYGDGRKIGDAVNLVESDAFGSFVDRALRELGSIGYLGAVLRERLERAKLAASPRRRRLPRPNGSE
jgi:hypothetical protein